VKKTGYQVFCIFIIVKKNTYKFRDLKISNVAPNLLDVMNILDLIHLFHLSINLFTGSRMDSNKQAATEVYLKLLRGK
jgi:hypothetical protein